MHCNPCVTIYHWKAFQPMCYLSCLQFPAIFVDSFKKKVWLSRAIMRHLKSSNCDLATLLSSPLIAVNSTPMSSPDRSGCGLLWCHCTYEKHLNSASNTTIHLSTFQIWKGPNPLKSRWSINSLYFLPMCVESLCLISVMFLWFHSSSMKQQSSSQSETPSQTAQGLTAQEGFG